MIRQPTPSSDTTADDTLADDIGLALAQAIRPLYRHADTWGVMPVADAEAADWYEVNKTCRNLDRAFQDRARENTYHGGVRPWTMM